MFGLRLIALFLVFAGAAQGQNRAPAPGAPTPPPAAKASPLTAEEEQKSFALPPGFEIEVVAADPEIPKVVTVAFDDRGRMWAVTASEYPVDANESPAEAERLYQSKGRDRVLVFDTPTAAGPQAPRTFADGLAIPLGVLPLGNGAIVPHGSNIFFFKDTDGDGKADVKEVLLSGFGVQDSHLMPHQLTLGPGGWIYVAQGAFNSSNVRGKDGQTTLFEQCKLGRFKPDGTKFQVAGYGLNNIWGLVIDRHGQFFIQEANDLGYPVVPFYLGASYPGIGMHRAHPYSPWQPPLADFAMGGTGLSGLALCEEARGFPAPYQGVMFVANPITRQIQMIRVTADGPRYRLERLPDFLNSSDPWFRPVSITFGPDSALYIVDWYNKIISHNEVPRNHPDRDKIRGRIWRVRHQGMQRWAIPDLTRQSESQLIESLASPVTWQARAALHQIVERKLTGLEPTLQTIVEAGDRPVDLRLRALWALEGLGPLRERMLALLVRDASRDLRREAIRIVGEHSEGKSPPLEMLRAVRDDPDPQVRAELIRCLQAFGAPTPDSLRLLLELAKTPLDGPTVQPQQGGGPVHTGAAADRDFERSLARETLEAWPGVVAQFIESSAARDLPDESLVFGAVALNNEAGARKLAETLGHLTRRPADEEIQLLASHADLPAVQKSLQSLLFNDATSVRALTALANSTSTRPAPGLNALLIETVRRSFERRPSEGSEAIALSVIRKFRLQELAPDVAAQSLTPEHSAEFKLAAVKTLRELDYDQVEQFQTVALQAKTGEPLQREAILSLASSSNARALPLLFELWPVLPAYLRKNAVDELAGSAAKSRVLLAAVKSGQLAASDIDPASWKKLSLSLGPQSGIEELISSATGEAQPVLRLAGHDQDFVETALDLEGPFTVESWIKLDPGINNQDALLGNRGQADFNFFEGRFRFFAGGEAGDVAIAKTKLLPDVWRHLAATRDAAGECRLYLDGELDSIGSKKFTGPLRALDVGRASAPGGTAASVAELRIWDRARSADEIKNGYQSSIAGEGGPAGLRHVFSGTNWGQVRGEARVEKTFDYPPLQSPEKTAAERERFERFLGYAGQSGDAMKGQETFRNICQVCHSVGGEGGNIGPVLNGASTKGTDALLHAILTPSAAVESGYHLYRLETTESEVLDGFLVSQTPSAITVRPPTGPEVVIARERVKKSGFTRQSIMPDGLLDGLKPVEVSDLFSYLRSLK